MATKTSSKKRVTRTRLAAAKATAKAPAAPRARWAIASAEWGDGVVEELAADLARRYPGLRGYTRPNLFRMRQLHEAYRSNRKVSPLVRQLLWTRHLIILSQARPVETRDLYILAAIKERDFCFVGSQYPVQVGNQDFAIDRDVKKPHERPSVGVLLCATKDDEVVEYALARTTSPTLVAEYQTLLPPKTVLRAKLHELHAQLAPATGIKQSGSLRRTRVSTKKSALR